MSDITIALTSAECSALFSAVTNERDALQSDLDNNNISKADISAARASIETCNSLLAKLTAASPNSTYSFCENRE